MEISQYLFFSTSRYEPTSDDLTQEQLVIVPATASTVKNIIYKRNCYGQIWKLACKTILLIVDNNIQAINQQNINQKQDNVINQSSDPISDDISNHTISDSNTKDKEESDISTTKHELNLNDIWNSL
ncbi:hypothetical protein C2G38_2169981 [Gigaspora rosea]|uniref:Uncharacterized protein n=1 Tax=Gigaspora rosea TaxID=44941 RepID=A0A397VSA9_9GLOM|nr:hypothetical protein C2G38_2169981 [Gigaspora rosea]